MEDLIIEHDKEMFDDIAAIFFEHIPDNMPFMITIPDAYAGYYIKAGTMIDDIDPNNEKEVEINNTRMIQDIESGVLLNMDSKYVAAAIADICEKYGRAVDGINLTCTVFDEGTLQDVKFKLDAVI